MKENLFWEIIQFDLILQQISHGYYFSDWYDVRRQASLFSSSQLSLFRDVVMNEFVYNGHNYWQTLQEMFANSSKHVRVDTSYGPCKFMCDTFIEPFRHLSTMAPLPPLPPELFTWTIYEIHNWIQSPYMGPYFEAHELLRTLPDHFFPVEVSQRLTDYQFLMEGRGDIVDLQGKVVGKWALRLDLGPFFKPCRCWG